jgi:hypothetical protein
MTTIHSVHIFVYNAVISILCSDYIIRTQDRNHCIVHKEISIFTFVGDITQAYSQFGDLDAAVCVEVCVVVILATHERVGLNTCLWS